LARIDARKPTQLRPITITRGYTRHAAGSVLIRAGETVVLCTASWEPGVPPWRKGSGKGWVTAEYDMLPGATHTRRGRNRSKIDGRTQEIQRLIGRSLRAVVDFEKLGENSVLIDCDVLQADGGTRTASITGAYIALVDAVRHAAKNKLISQMPIVEQVAAISVGRAGGKMLLDLNYAEDSTAEVDFNVVMTGDGRFVEVQGTGETGTFTQQELQRMTALAARGIRELFTIQQKTLRKKVS